VALRLFGPGAVRALGGTVRGGTVRGGAEAWLYNRRLLVLVPGFFRAQLNGNQEARLPSQNSQPELSPQR
jgi:hypothetical protein